MNVRLSVVVVTYDMARELPRTLHSLSRPYQRDVTDDYEIIVVDNGSPNPCDPAPVLETGCGPRLRVHHMPVPASISPAAALNHGVELARGELLCLVVDGARLASPGLLGQGIRAAGLQDEPLVATLAWHLGPDVQARSILHGYDEAAEDELLRSIEWPSDGYRLFDVSTPAPSSALGFLLPLPETSALFVAASTFRRLGGFDERFEQPGGGLVAADFFRRAVDGLANDPIVLLGEGTFHQLHAPPGRQRYEEVAAAYRTIRGVEFAPPTYRPVLYGQPRPATLALLGRSSVLAANAMRRGERPWAVGGGGERAGSS